MVVEKNSLSETDIKELIKLGKKIQLSLSCNINGSDLPCLTDRFSAINDMIKYLEIHNCKIISNNDFDVSKLQENMSNLIASQKNKVGLTINK